MENKVLRTVLAGVSSAITVACAEAVNTSHNAKQRKTTVAIGFILGAACQALLEKLAADKARW